MTRGALYVLFTASGFAGLIYESIWTQYLKLFLGHAAYAQSLVLAVFMGGMALGAAGCARASARLANPLMLYAMVEGLVGLAALVFHPLFVALTDWSYDRLLPALGSAGLALAAKLTLCALLILPQCVLLGATFPLMSAALVRAMPRAAGESLAMLYFTNSLGGAIGVLASGFVLIAALGLPGTLRSAGAINVVIALAEALMHALGRTEGGDLLFNLSGAALAALVMLPAPFFGGMTLPLITVALLRRGRGEAAIGQVYAANTLGAIAGVVLAVHVGLPLLGLKGTLLLGSLIDAALGLALLRVFEVRKRVAFATVACAVLFLAAVLAVELDANKMT